MRFCHNKEEAEDVAQTAECLRSIHNAIRLGMAVRACNPELERRRQEDQFKVILSFRVSLRPAWDT